MNLLLTWWSVALWLRWRTLTYLSQVHLLLRFISNDSVREGGKGIYLEVTARKQQLSHTVNPLVQHPHSTRSSSHHPSSTCGIILVASYRSLTWSLITSQIHSINLIPVILLLMHLISYEYTRSCQIINHFLLTHNSHRPPLPRSFYSWLCYINPSNFTLPLSFRTVMTENDWDRIYCVHWFLLLVRFHFIFSLIWLHVV